MLGGFDQNLGLVDVAAITQIDPFFDKDQDGFVEGFAFTNVPGAFDFILRDADDNDPNVTPNR